METTDRMTELESELKILKNEVQAVLLDLRDKYLETENPFNPAPPVAREQIVVDRQTTATKEPESPAANYSSDNSVPGNEEEEDMPQNEPQEDDPVCESEPVSPPAPGARPLFTSPATPSQTRTIDLVTISGLARWADQSLKRLGRTRTETILDFSEMMGLLSPDLKQVMSKLVNTDEDRAGITQAKDYLDSLLEITSLLGKDNRTEVTMLSILAAEDNHR